MSGKREKEGWKREEKKGEGSRRDRGERKEQTVDIKKREHTGSVAKIISSR